MLLVRVRRGFTLVEVLVALSLVIIITAMTVPTYGRFIDRQSLKQDAFNLKTDLESAKARSLSNIEPSAAASGAAAWGLRATGGTNQYQLGNWEGSTFTARQTKLLARRVTFGGSGTYQAVFTALSGELDTSLSSPLSAGKVDFVLQTSGGTMTVSVYWTGRVEVN